MSEPQRGKSWFTRAVLGIVVATFFSDVGHEMVTAVLPLYLTSVGLGAAALGVMEGIADFLFSLSKLAGGAVGHGVERKKRWAALGYTLTTVGSAAMAHVQGSLALAVFRGVAWFGRGFRSRSVTFSSRTRWGRSTSVAPTVSNAPPTCWARSPARSSRSRSWRWALHSVRSCWSASSPR